MSHILLLAEPSLTIQRVVQLTFANEDIDVVIATDGAEAIEQAERLRPAIVLADVALARHTGYEVAAYFKRTPKFAGIPVVLLSGAFERVDSARAAEAGCDLVLSKPFEPRHLLAQVRGLLPGSPTSAQDAAAIAGGLRATPAGFVPAAPRVPAPAAEPVAAVSTQASAAQEFAAPTWPVPDLPHAARPEVVEQAPPARQEFVVPAPARMPDAPTAATAVEVPEEDPMLGLPADWSVPVAPVEPVPSFEMLALTNKSMHLVPSARREEAQPESESEGGETPPQATSYETGVVGHDLGNLIPALDDYFDQLDAAFATGAESTFRKMPEAPPLTAAPIPSPPAMMPPAPPAVVLSPPAPVAPVTEPVAPIEVRSPAVSPFSMLRLETPARRPTPPVQPPVPPPAATVVAPVTPAEPVAPAAPVSIDDAYDALMKQLREPRPRPSVVALRADDELLVERAVERVLEQLDTTALREALTDVVTALAKRVIQEEIERIRRP